MTRPDWVPEGIDTGKPSAARIYDYWLGGTHNFAVDREIARGVTAALPRHRAHDAGQPGVPAPGRRLPDRRRAYASSSTSAPASRPSATCTRSRRRRRPRRGSSTSTSTRSRSRTAVTSSPATPTRPSCAPTCATSESILASEEVHALLDFDQPVAVLMLAVLHFVPDEDDPAGVVARFRRPPGAGQLPGAFARHPGRHDPGGRRGRATASSPARPPRSSAVPGPRSTALFDGFDLVEPGIVWSVEWRPEHPDEVGDDPERSAAYVGVGRKR